MSEPPIISKKLEKELRQMGALLVSTSVVVFKVEHVPEESFLEEKGLVFTSKDSSGRVWYEYDPTVDEQ